MRLKWLALLLLLVTACSRVPQRPAQPGAAPATEGQMTTLKVFANPDPAFENMVSAIHARFPNVRIERVGFGPGSFSGNISDFFKEKIKAGEVDLVAPFGGIKSLIDDNLLLNLEPYIQKSKFDLKPVAGIVDQLRWDGKLYDLPVSMMPEVLLYNRDLFEKEGVPLPKEGWTWDQFRQAARRLTKGEGESKQWGFWAQNPDNLVLPYMFQKTGSYLGMTDEKAMYEGLQFFNSMTFSDKSMPQAQKRESGASVMSIRIGAGPEDPFGRGNAAMSLQYLMTLNFLAQQLKFRWEVAPLPMHPGAKSSAMVNVNSLGIAATSKNADHAWQVLSFMAGPQGAAVTARSGAVPLYNTPEVRKAWFDRQPVPPPGSETLFTTTWTTFPRNVHDRLAQLIQAYGKLVNGVLSGHKPLEDAFAEYRQDLARIEAEHKK